MIEVVRRLERYSRSPGRIPLRSDCVTLPAVGEHRRSHDEIASALIQASPTGSDRASNDATVAGNVVTGSGFAGLRTYFANAPWVQRYYRQLWDYMQYMNETEADATPVAQAALVGPVAGDRSGVAARYCLAPGRRYGG